MEAFYFVVNHTLAIFKMHKFHILCDQINLFAGKGTPSCLVIMHCIA